MTEVRVWGLQKGFVQQASTERQKVKQHLHNLYDITTLDFDNLFTWQKTPYTTIETYNRIFQHQNCK